MMAWEAHHAPHEKEAKERNTSESASDATYDYICVGSTRSASGRGGSGGQGGGRGERVAGDDLGGDRERIGSSCRLDEFRWDIFTRDRKMAYGWNQGS